MKIQVSNLIAHISDIHIRYGSRHEEYRIVFQRTIDDLKKQDIRRIVLAGDLFHIKITLSPNALSLAGWFLQELAKIAPVDIILGNHDINLQSLDQGNAIEPIIELINGGYIVEKGSKELPEHNGEGYGIYFFLYSGFYNIDEEIVYGVYSCLDNEILTLKEKKKDKKYIALYHGAVYGCLGNNGYELKGEHLMNLSTFNNFDVVMMGDIHEQQSFCRVGTDKETIVYSGSLIQQGFSESLKKGYLVWNIDDYSYEKKFIDNDYGYSVLHISKGEIVEERIRELKVSKNPKKTKVSIVWEEFEENYSVEKEKQIEKLVKTIYGCENVSVECQYVSKKDELDALVIDEDVDYSDSHEFEKLLKDFVKNSEYDNEEEVVKLSREIDKILNFNTQKGKKWFLNKMEVWNLFSFPENETSFDFDELSGVTGIFGKNFNGKSNIIRAIVWILYKKILGGGDSNKLVNMYTDKEDGGGRVYLTIDTEKYFIERVVKVKIKKDGTPDVSYDIDYKKLMPDNKWKSLDSDKAATEKKERSNIIVESIGTFEDFTKVVLQAQSGEGNYLNMSQQPKNDLINKYLGLEIFRDRYEYAKQTYNEIKTKQKILGDPKEYEKSIKEEGEKIKSNEGLLVQCDKEKKEADSQIEKYDFKIIEFTKKLIKTEETEYKTVESANDAIIKQESLIENTSKEIIVLEKWLSENFKKELPSESLLSYGEIEKQLSNERSLFEREKSDFTILEKWIKENPKKLEIELEPISIKINEIENAISKLKDTLTISKGKKCPTCANVEQVANVDLEKKCLEDIKRGEDALKVKKEELEKAKEIFSHNTEYDKEGIRLGSLKNSLQTRKLNIDKFKVDLDLSKSIDEIKTLNKSIDENSVKLDNKRKCILDSNSTIEKIKREVKILKDNRDLVEKNDLINQEIKDLESEKKIQRLILNQLNEKITECKSTISVAKNNIKNYEEKLISIVNAEKSYGKYSIYLQAVHRDGIPAKIIKTKLPIINHRINSILKNLVEFKIELLIKDNGDIKEIFYFNSAEKDALPMSMASGAQNFIGSVAIRDSLHFVSSLTKPSLCIIDEGFGSLDDELTFAMETVFNYLKNKYKNTWIITHKNEIKDFVDNIIQVSKTQKGLTKEQIEENPKAGISVFDINKG